MKLVNTDIGGGPEPVIKTKNLEYGIGEAYKVGIEEETLELTGSGDYELTFELQLKPKGIDPEPGKIKFWIPVEEVAYLPKPVEFQEQDIHRIDPVFTGAKVMKEEKEDLYSAAVFNPIAELEGIHHARNMDEIIKGLIIHDFVIRQFGEHKWALENYEIWREHFAKRQNAKFEDDAENLECRLLYSSKIKRWINFKPVYSTWHYLEAIFIYRAAFYIRCRISIEEGDFSDLSKRWQKMRDNCKTVINERLRQLK